MSSRAKDPGLDAGVSEARGNWLTIFGVVLLWFFVPIGCVVGLGYFFLFHVVLGGTSRIEAFYPGMNLLGEPELWSWSYNIIEITVPKDVDLYVQLGNQAPVEVKKVTPAMVEKYLLDLGNARQFVHVDSNGQNAMADGAEFKFCEGFLAYANIQSRSKNISFYRGSLKFTLPLSQREVDAIFGEPVRTQRYTKFI